jgi:hypothetical protein
MPASVGVRVAEDGMCCFAAYTVGSVSQQEVVMEPIAVRYPAAFTFDPPERVANWRALVNWLLAIPQLLVVGALRYVSQLLAVVCWFIILFTGRLPGGLANFQVMYLRYYVRTALFAGFLREEYPPFDFTMTPNDPGGDPRVHVDVIPQLESRNRVTVGFRLILAIPQLIVLVLLAVAGGVVLVIAFFAVLFTGRWPAGLRHFTLGVLRWWLRVEAYLLLLSDQYPPFALD